jgi:serine/threonine protein kinase
MSGIPAGAGSLIGKRLGKYEILALLALGGTAEIYLARIGGAAGFEKFVVIKCLHDHLADDTEFVKMFLDEARLAAVLDHSNIVQTFELGEHEDRYYMVMEFLAGVSLAMIVRRATERLPGGKIPVPLILNIAAQACAGLHYAHERQANGKPLNMVHRDISPQNLVISFEGVVKVVDWGIARADQRDTKTKAGTIKGKFAYMSPEQCVASNIDRRTDVFALGVIIWELLTGRRLFKRNSPYETYQAVIECAVPVPSTINVELDPAIDAIVMKAVAKDKEQRFPTAEALGDALLGYLHHRGKSSGPADVGRFLEQYFNQEIEEHGERMRELIANREFQVDSSVNWGDDEDEKKNAETVDLGGPDVSLQTGDIIPLRPSEASLVGPNEARNDDDEIPADRTRIEQNPLEKVKELDRASQRIKPGNPVPAGSVTGGPAPLPPAPAVRQSRKATELGVMDSGKFPDLANLPTVIADNETPPPEAYPTPPPGITAAELAATELHGRTVDPRHGQTGNHPSQRPTSMPHASVGRAGPVSTTQDAARPLQAVPVPSSPPGGSMYPVVSGRPFSSDLAPSHLPQPQRSPYTADSAPAHAANIMSPVGDQYPQHDWAAVAARPAKAIPPWMLAVLFVVALGLALTITIVIAKIVR